MPAFHMPIGSSDAGREFHAMSDFEQAYAEAMFFTDLESLEGLTFDDMSQEAINTIRSDCDAFLASLEPDDDGNTALDRALQGDYSRAQAGHDFWLTRNGHGAGFWDRGLGEAGEELTQAAHSFGECSLYVGDDGRLHLDRACWDKAIPNVSYPLH